ncbi:MAG: IS4 family transposase [Bryobacteraceae bacterium]
MIRVCSIFSQLLQLFPRLEFEAAVRKHQAERHARGFECWAQFIAMLFCQLGQAHSLREICGGLSATEGKLKHLGLDGAPRRSTLAYANGHRPWQLFQTVFQELLGRCHQVAHAEKKRFRFKNPLLIIDSTVVQLALSMFDWALYQKEKGAAKIHLVLEHQGLLPHFAVITEGKGSDLAIARGLRFPAGTILVFDRGYQDYRWFAQLTEQRVFFVTRLRCHAHMEVLADLPVVDGSQIVRFQEVRIGSQKFRMAQKLRLIESRDPETGKTIILITNHFRLAATTLADVYRERWQIEVFFRALKQNLRLKSFVGTSQNAVQIQIWTALIAILLLKYLQLRSTFAWSLSNLVALLRQQLFVYRDLWTWLEAPFQPPPALPPESLQLSLRFS